MRFMMLMIPKGYEKAAPGAMPDAKAVAAMMKYNESLQKAGVLLALDGLHPPAMGARVSFSGGKPKVTDGPFAEAKEVLGGYWMIEVKSREEAIEWASRLPGLGQRGDRGSPSAGNGRLPADIKEVAANLPRAAAKAGQLAAVTLRPEKNRSACRSASAVRPRQSPGSGAHQPESRLATRSGRSDDAFHDDLQACRYQEGGGECPRPSRKWPRWGIIGEMAKAGVLLAADGAIERQARVRLFCKVTVTDGPFTVEKELIAGFAIVQVKSKAEAIEWARRFLALAGDGESEIRQMHDVAAFAA